jgi:hypothetical protein
MDRRIATLWQRQARDLAEASAVRVPGLGAAASPVRRMEPMHASMVEVRAVVGEQRVHAAKATGRVVLGRKLRRRLLAGGIAASLLAAGTDVLAGKLWAGYDFFAQSISELAAVGAPTRLLVVPLNLTCDALMIAFGIGVWTAAGESRAQRVTASMVIGNVVVSVAWAFFPMHVGEPPSPANVAVGAVSMVLFVLAICCGAVAYRGFFRLYSIATLLAYIVLTILGLLAGRAAPADGPGSIGVQERTMALGYLLWVVALAVTLRRADKRHSLASGGDA